MIFSLNSEHHDLISLLQEDAKGVIEVVNKALNQKSFNYQEMQVNNEESQRLRFFVGVILNKFYLGHLESFLIKIDKQLIPADSLKKICSLNLGYCGLGVEATKFLSAFLETNKILKFVDLSGNDFADEGVANIFQSLALNTFHKQLELELFDNSITEKGALYIKENLLNAANRKSILKVNLLLNEIKQEGTEYLIELVRHLIKHSNFEVFFQLNKNNLNEEVGRLFFSSLDLIETLNFFDLNYNKLKTEGLSHLSSISLYSPIKNNFSTLFLEHLNIANNNIQDEGLFHISNALGKFLFVKNINIKGNEITAEGLKYFSATLTKIFDEQRKITEIKSQLNSQSESHYVIESLDLSCNNLARGMVYLANFIMSNHRIISLDISSCFLGPVDIIILAKALKMNKYLRRLDIGNNHFYDDGLIEFCKILAGETYARGNEENNIINNNSGENDTEHFLFRKSLSFSAEEPIQKKDCISALETLHINHNKITDETLTHLAKYLRSSVHLKNLSVTYSLFTSSMLPEFMKSCVHLLSLNMSECRHVNPHFIFKSIYENQIYKLNGLFFSNCNFNMLTSLDSLKFFRYHPIEKITTLDFSFNGISDQHFKLIISSLLKNERIKTIDKLNFASNLITDEGLILLKNLLNETKILINEIKLNKNNISLHGYKFVSKNNHAALPILDLRDNNLVRPVRDYINFYILV